MPLALAAVEYGAGPPLAILPGLFGSGRNWTSIAQGLAPHHRAQADVALAAAIPDAAERAFLLQNLIFNNGGARWRLNLKAIEQGMPALVEFPATPAGRTYDGPALFLAGGRSDYVQPAYEPAIRRFFPKHEIARIEKAGHWLHAEQPAEFLAIIERFLSR